MKRGARSEDWSDKFDRWRRGMDCRRYLLNGSVFHFLLDFAVGTHK